MRMSLARGARWAVALATLAVTLSASLLTGPAGASGDPVVSSYLIADPLPNGVAESDAALLPIIASVESQENALLAGKGYAKVAVGAWVDPATHQIVISELVALTITLPSIAANITEGANAACPQAAGVTPVFTAVAAIPGSQEVSCTNAQNGLPSTAVAWYASHILTVVVTFGLTSAQCEAIATTQAAALPTSNIVLDARTSYNVTHFAKDSAALSASQKLQIYQDAVAIKAMSPTAIHFTAHQSVVGKSAVTRTLAVNRVRAVFHSLVARLRQLGLTQQTLQQIGLGSGSPQITRVQRGSASASLSVTISMAYLL